jgi:hypothetical protein
LNDRRVFEIYDISLRQRFRSPNFFSYTSHTLEDLESRAYWQNFKKSEKVDEEIFSKAKAILVGAQTAPDYHFVGDNGEQKLWEINSPRKLVTNLRSVVVAPIHDAQDGIVAGLIHICEVQNQVELFLVDAEKTVESSPRIEA